MPTTLPEADWKAFRALKEKALERFYQGVLAEIGDLSRDGSLSDHDRYASIYRRLEQREAERSRAFDDSRRSTMLLQLLTIVRL